MKPAPPHTLPGAPHKTTPENPKRALSAVDVLELRPTTRTNRPQREERAKLASREGKKHPQPSGLCPPTPTLLGTLVPPTHPITQRHTDAQQEQPNATIQKREKKPSNQRQKSPHLFIKQKKTNFGQSRSRSRPSSSPTAQVRLDPICLFFIFKIRVCVCSFAVCLFVLVAGVGVGASKFHVWVLDSRCGGVGLLFIP